jgi:hypothetical protein
MGANMRGPPVGRPLTSSAVAYRRIVMWPATLSGAVSLEIIAHHPQAVYFGLKSGFLPKDKAPDDIIAGSDRDATLRRGDTDPREGPPEDEPALVGDARA